MKNYSLTTLTVFFYPTQEALQRALEREKMSGVYSDALVFDLKQPVCAGEVTRFRNNIRALHEEHGMNVASRDGTMPGYLVLFHKGGTTMNILAQQGVSWDRLPNDEKDSTIERVKAQRRLHSAALRDVNSRLVTLRSI